jgi:phosphate starvation-inducible PhoH-like protein
MNKKKSSNTAPKVKQPPLRKVFKPKTQNQAEYIRCMSESDIIFCTGPAGSGKTAVAVGLACEYILSGKVEKSL